MEDWTFPAAYDPAYKPAAESRYWFPQRETMSTAEREPAILHRLQEVTAYAYERAPFYRRIWDEAGFHPSQLKSLEDFEDKVPVITKEDLRASQSAFPPFGDYLCIDDSEVFHIHGTSGTTGDPTAFAIGRHDWEAIANAHARVMWGMGLRPGDIVFIAAVFSLYMGSWATLAGAERLGAVSFPFGAGAPGMSVRAVNWLKRMRPKAFYGTPSYALYLADVARNEGIDPREFGLEVLIFGGEPGASIPGVRDKITAAYGGRVVDVGSMAEMTPWVNAAGSYETQGMLLWQDMVYTEVCDPQTSRRVPYGQQGTPIYTHLERTSQPMIRLLSGDLTRWEEGPALCGRTYPCLPNGIFGRIDDAFTIRGENVYPSEIDAVLNELEDYGGEHRIIISRDGAMDELLVQVEGKADVYESGTSAKLRQRAAADLQRVLGIRTQVEVVALETFPRTDFKARRVVDDREVFRDMNKRLEQ
jgi:phenylacetate-CoA ligase